VHLSELQERQRAFDSQRGWAENPFEVLFLYLAEEVGELSSSLQKIWKATDRLMDGQCEPRAARQEAMRLCTQEAGSEMADCLLLLASLANATGVDLDAAVDAKLRRNEQRTWACDRRSKADQLRAVL